MFMKLGHSAHSNIGGQCPVKRTGLTERVEK